jgi:predicted transcriptional regulator of viral defense system
MRFMTTQEDQTRSISSDAYRVLSVLRREQRSHLSLPEDADLLREITPSSPWRLAARMVRTGALIPLSRGRYAVAPIGATSLRQAAPIELLVHARLSPNTPYFISYFSGLVEHGLTDLDSNAIYAAVRKEVRATEVAGSPLVTTIIKAERRWFGEEKVTVERSGYYMRAQLERVLLDTLDRPKLCGSVEVVGRAWERAFRENRVNGEWLVEHAPLLGQSVARRAAFWLDRLGRDDLASALTPSLGDVTDPVALDASQAYGDGDWPVDGVWGVRVNVPEAAIRGWLAYGK